MKEERNLHITEREFKNFKIETRMINFYFIRALNNSLGGLSPFTNYSCSARIQNGNSDYSEQGSESFFQTKQGGQ